MSVIFSAEDSNHGRELWICDGTAGGTRLLKDIAEGAFSSQPGSLVAYGGRISFQAFDGEANRDLWITDGSEAGTQKIADIATPFPYVYATPPVVAGNRLFMDAPSSNGGHGQDRIVLDHTVFAKLGGAGALRAAYFNASHTASDGNDVMLYNRATGVVLYDADGNGAGEAVRVAVLSNKPALSAADFLVI